MIQRKLHAMDAITALIIIIGLIAYGLERNRHHQDGPNSRLAGSSDIVDRDRERLWSDLQTRT